MAYVMKFNILRWPAWSDSSPSVCPHLPRCLICSVSSSHTSLLSVPQHVNIFLAWEPSYTLFPLPGILFPSLLRFSQREGTEQGDFLFSTSWPCFCKLSEPHGANEQPSMSAFHCSQPPPGAADPDSGEREWQHSKYRQLLFTLPAALQQDEGNGIRSSQPWCHQTLAVCF